jgi:hypothetical protein
MPPSKEEQLRAIDTEITRTQNFIKYIESKLTPIQLEAATRRAEPRPRAARKQEK